MVSLIVACVMFVLSIILLVGKGSWLIAGFNTRNKDQKEKYDKDKLSRVAGVMLLIITIATLLLNFLHSGIFAIIYIMVVIISVILTIIYMNIKCKKTFANTEKPNIYLGQGKISTNVKKLGSITIVAIVGIIIAISMIISLKPPVYSINNGIFSISTEFGQKIYLSDIKSVQLKNELPANLSKVDGLGIGTILKGKYSSDIGDVTVYIDTSAPPFIYINTKFGLIILNDRAKTQTQTLYEELNSNVKH
ncbi:hypothetical protein CEB3_c39260 [Peptococcaceae bacterium CEB3]|nr:hypothetical protein CEB3_c39260 [Peptococcaceae bacterium CEB3]